MYLPAENSDSYLDETLFMQAMMLVSDLAGNAAIYMGWPAIILFKRNILSVV